MVNVYGHDFIEKFVWVLLWCIDISDYSTIIVMNKHQMYGFFIKYLPDLFC